MRRLLLFVCALLGFVACTQDVIEEQTTIRTDAPDTIQVGFEENSTRIQLNEAQKTVWTKDDLASVFYLSNANQKWQYQGETGERVGNLKRVENATATAQTNKVVVVYPYREDHYLNYESCNLHATLPATQYYTEGSYGVGSNLMVSQSEFTQFSLKSVCGWLKLQLTGNGEVVKSIKFRGNNDEQVAGLIYVDTATAEATLASEMGSSDDNNAGGNLVFDDTILTEVVLDCGEGVELGAEPTAFYISLPPQSFEGGFTVEVECEGYELMTLSTENELVIERNAIQPMASVEVEFVAPVVKPANNEIWYTNGSTTELTEPYKTNAFGVNIVSNTYDAKKECWIIKFDGEVTAIGEEAFYNCSNLTSIAIPDSVTSIGDYAFYNCSSLTITIPSSVTSIGRNAFYYCTGELIVNCNIPSATSYKYGAFYYSEFTKVTIGDGVTSIGDYAFYNCSSLTSVTIPDGVTSIGDYSFRGCSSLTSITIPDSVTSIGSSAFSGCSSLMSITIPDGVTSIGSSAFSGCSGLMSITIPDGVTSIGTLVFNNCSSLTSATIGNSVTSIGYATFAGCSSLTSVTIGNSVTTIGGSAFSRCSSLTSITIPDSVTEIGGSAFSDCSSLTNITIPDSVTSIGSSAFSGCSSLTEFKGGYASEDGRCLIKDGTLISFAPAGLTEYTIPNSVTSIGDYAFEYCSNLTSVTIPNGVTSIGYKAFYRCTYITSITIPDSVTFIGNYAFQSCFRLASVYCKPETPPTTVEDSYMFYENASDRKIYVPIKSVESYKNAKWWSTYAYAIEGYNFAAEELSKPANNEIYYTNGSTTEAITPNVNDGFGANIISNTYDTEKECWVIKFDGIVTKIGDSAFYSCKNLTSITIPDSVSSIGTLAFASCSSLTSPIILDCVTTIGDRAFSYCRSLTTVTIPDGVTSIKWETFMGCSSLASVTIPNSVTLIDFRAFYECSSLTSITIPNSVTSIRENTFGECSSLHGITIPNSVTEIRGGAFIGCRNLQYVNFPNSLTTIGSGAFRWCSSLTGIIIPESVTSIGELAFDGCSDLKDVSCKATTPPIGGSGMFYLYSEDEDLWPHIYVPVNSVNAYKSAEYWSDYADAIVGYGF